MKKLYQEEKWKSHSSKRSETVLKSRSRTRRGRGPAKKSAIYTYPKVWKHKNSVRIIAPTNFSLVENPEEMLNFFHDVRLYLQRGDKIFFDMAGIGKMTTDAILYMLSRFENYKQQLARCDISGNVPDNEESRNIFIQSGFYSYVRTTSRSLKSNSDILTVQSGTRVEPSIAQQVARFARARIGSTDRQISKSIYSTMIECMANTRNHAYKDSGKWWLMAAFREQSKAVHFTFLDNGLTIPTTVKKSMKEYVTHLAGTMLPVRTNQDCGLIESALKGEFRTKTGMLFRGKGLPKIYEYSTNEDIKNLVVISHNGYVDVGSGNSHDLSKQFYGTLLS
ncbi:MAG: hypothetical protein WCQ90_05260, partial [Deltaproteobacteria bacterium]